MIKKVYTVTSLTILVLFALSIYGANNTFEEWRILHELEMWAEK
jgi:hypothetical protein